MIKAMVRLVNYRSSEYEPVIQMNDQIRVGPKRFFDENEALRYAKLAVCLNHAVVDINKIVWP